jgi:hypothetical protein
VSLVTRIFFYELQKVFGQPNPQKHLRHIAFDLDTFIAQNNQEIKHYKELIRKYAYHLNGILNSKSWKLVLKTKKILRK